MVAFSCCVYDGGEAEKVDMDSIRERGWRKKFKLKEHLISPSLNRVNGKCPLTPLEVPRMIRFVLFVQKLYPLNQFPHVLLFERCSLC